MLKSQKHVFWEALLVTVLIFIVGILLGNALEQKRTEKIDDYYAQSEISLMDILIFQDIIKTNSTNCDTLIDSNIEFADKIYEEAILLSKYDDQQLTNSAELAQKRYSLLRTLLWMNIIKTQERCEKDFNSIIYLYSLNQEDLTKKAEQKVWSNMLQDLKGKYGNKIILIPIAVDKESTSLNTIIKNHNITELPAIIINNKVLTEIVTKDELEKEIIN